MTAETESFERAMTDRNWDRRQELIERIEVSILYHAKRERFLDSIERFMQALVTASASGGVALLLAVQTTKTVELWLMATAAVVSMIQLAYGLSAGARLHARLRYEFRQLLSECVEAGERWDEVACDRFTSRTVKLEADEPPQLGALVVVCENELAIASNDPTAVVHIPIYMRWLKHLWNWDTTRLRNTAVA